MENRNGIFFIFLIILISILSGCEAVAELFHGPNPEEQELTKETIIYIVGNDVNTAGKKVATVWKNRIATTISDGTKDSSAYAITASGSDIYIAGENDGIGTVWKNGVIAGVYTNYSVSLTAVSKIAVVGSDVYISGKDYLLKNGISQPLTVNGNNTSNIIALTADSSDVYLLFKMNNPYGNPQDYYYLWKNGTITYHTLPPINDSLYISSSVRGTVANAMTVVSSNIYIAGREIRDDLVRNGGVWKNFVGTRYASGDSTTPIAIVVSGSDVYIAANDSKNGSGIWKNGVKTLLAGGESLTINGMTVVGSDVYVTGTVKNASNRTVAMLWKNGVGTALTDGLTDAVANALVVVRK